MPTQVLRTSGNNFREIMSSAETRLSFQSEISLVRIFDVSDTKRFVKVFLASSEKEMPVCVVVPSWHSCILEMHSMTGVA